MFGMTGPSAVMIRRLQCSFIRAIGLVIIPKAISPDMRGFFRPTLMGVSTGFAQCIETWNAAAILGGSILFASNVARIKDAGFTGTDIGDGDPMLPAVTEVVEIIDDVLAGLQHIAQADFAGFDARFGSPILVCRQAISPFADRE